jgi:hypothetical protein
MKYIKRFESIKEDIKVGDYVIIRDDIKGYSPEYLIFLRNNIGVIKSIEPGISFSDIFLGAPAKKDIVTVEFDKAFSDNQRHEKINDVGVFYSGNIDSWSSNKEELQWILDAKKYNL